MESRRTTAMARRRPLASSVPSSSSVTSKAMGTLLCRTNQNHQPPTASQSNSNMIATTLSSSSSSSSSSGSSSFPRQQHQQRRQYRWNAVFGHRFKALAVVTAAPLRLRRRLSDPDRRVNRRGSHKSHIDQSDVTGNIDNPIPQAIQLFDLNIGDTRLLKIANTLRHNQVVKTINLSHNAFGSEGVFALAVALQEDGNIVERLTLCGNPNMGLSGVTALANAVPHCSHLRALNLSENQIGNAGCHALAHALTQPSTRIQELLLHSNRIGNEGAIVLATALAHNQTVTSLDLTDNVVGDEGMEALAEGLQSNMTLRHFYVGDNRFSIKGMKALYRLVAESNATLLAIHAPLRQEPKSERALDALRVLLDKLSFYLTLNQHGRAWIRSDQPNPALLPRVLQPLTTTTTMIMDGCDTMPLVYGLLRELPHVWAYSSCCNE